LAKAIRRLEAGDVLVVTQPDRLARSTRDLLNVIAAISERGAGFKSLKDTRADTTIAHGRLMLTVLGGLAEFERELIRARTGEGRKRAKQRGVRAHVMILARDCTPDSHLFSQKSAHATDGAKCATPGTAATGLCVRR